MLEIGRKRVYAAGLDQRIRLEQSRAEQLPFSDASFDTVTFSYLLRYVADPAATLRELARVLRPAGVLAGLDFFYSVEQEFSTHGSAGQTDRFQDRNFTAA